MKESIIIGKIIGVHGIAGEIKIFPITDDADRFFDLKRFTAGNKTYSVESVRLHKGNALIKTEQISDRTEAEKLHGLFVEVNREDAVHLSEGEYFIEDLKGLRLIDANGGQEAVLCDILQTGAVDIIEFKRGGEMFYMPYLNEYVTEVNIKEGYMRADLSKGTN